jgi:uncharacterized membrane protein YbaN (DUF454 family)
VGRAPPGPEPHGAGHAPAPSPRGRADHRRVRPLALAGGIVALGLGLLGAALPLLPTTPFLLLASFLLLRASPAVHDRLLAHPRIGPLLRRAKAARFTRGTKLGVFLLAVTMLLPVALLSQSHAVRGVIAIVLLAKAVFLLRMPGKRAPNEDAE